MSAKRALIVDDSKSARMFLSRILEKYELDVDMTETAELAMDYLAHHRPDVIFMDHLMPGMDGFQALQAIKNNPRTATIPIMMYTSQEGELYLGQARALGAVGVLPKQIKQADVSKVLYQLHLVPDRRTSAQSSFRPLTVDPLDDTGSASAITGTNAMLTDAALRAEFAELRHGLSAHIDNQFERMGADLRALVHDTLREAAPVPPLGASEARSGAWAVASLALAAAIIAIALWRREVNLHSVITAPPVAIAHVRGPAKLASAATTAAKSGAAIIDAHADPIIEPVPFGEDPLGGVRFEKVSQLLYRLAAQKYQGVVEIKSFPGRFCLVGNASDGYSLAPDELLFTKCDAVGSAREAAPLPAQRVSLPFANLLGEIRHASGGAIDVQLTSGDAAATVTPYPPVSPDLAAGQWNRAASANSRIEIRLR
jgi:CheY-like chemotaxis protein